jgi:hypothetical protein
MTRAPETIYGARLRDVHKRVAADGGTFMVALFELPRGADLDLPFEPGRLWTLTPETAGLVMPSVSTTSTMCPGCGEMRRVLGVDFEAQVLQFEAHHTAHNGVDGPLCDQGLA